MGEYAFGVIIGMVVAVALAILLIILLKGNGMGGFSERDYDERQQRARALSFKSGFFTVLIYNALYGVASAAMEPWCDAITGSFLGIFAGATVFAVVSIMRDAYIPVRDNRRRTTVFLGVVAAINALCSLRYILDPEESMIEDGLLTWRCMNTAITAMFVILFAAMIIKRGMDRREEEE